MMLRTSTACNFHLPNYGHGYEDTYTCMPERRKKVFPNMISRQRIES